MAPARHFVAAFCFCAALASATTGQAQIRVALYPPQGGDPGTRKEIRSLIQLGLSTAHRRGVVSANAVLLPESCPAPAAAPCLSRLAGEGVVLLAQLTPRGSGHRVVMTYFDARARSTPPVAFLFDSQFSDSALVDRALEQLEKGLLPNAEVAPAVATPPAAAPSPEAPAVAAQSPEPAQAPEPAKPAESGPAVGAQSGPEAAVAAPTASTEAEAPVERAWMRPIGQWVAVGGAALLAGGAAAGLVDRSINTRLTDAYRKGTLSPDDASAYRQVAALNVVANSLFVVGGLATAAGVTLWGLSPSATPVDGGAQVGLKGRF